MKKEYKNAELQLSMLAFMWKSKKEKEKGQARQIVKIYQQLLISIINDGFIGELSADDELPESLMPKAYLELLTQNSTDKD